MSLERGHRILIFLILWYFQYCVNQYRMQNQLLHIWICFGRRLRLYVFNVVHSEAIDWNIWMSTTQRPKKPCCSRIGRFGKASGGMSGLFCHGYTQTPPGKLILLGPKCIWFLHAPCAQTNPKKQLNHFRKTSFSRNSSRGKCVFSMVFYDSLRFFCSVPMLQNPTGHSQVKVISRKP